MTWHLLGFAIMAILFIILKTTRQIRVENTKLNEPPTIHISLWQFWKHGTQILDTIAAENMHKFHDGIFTVSILSWKIYVVSSPEVTLSIQARTKYASLGWISVLMMSSMGGQSKRATQLLGKGVNRGEVGSGVGFVHDYHKVELRTMSLGTGLDTMKKDFAISWEQLLDFTSDIS